MSLTGHADHFHFISGLLGWFLTTTPFMANQENPPRQSQTKTLSACTESSPYIVCNPRCTSLQFMFVWATSSGIMLFPPTQCSCLSLMIQRLSLRFLVHLCFLWFAGTWPIVSFLLHLHLFRRQWYFAFSRALAHPLPTANVTTSRMPAASSTPPFLHYSIHHSAFPAQQHFSQLTHLVRGPNTQGNPRMF